VSVASQVAEKCLATRAMAACAGGPNRLMRSFS
jgi:hypothetical protein